MAERSGLQASGDLFGARAAGREVEERQFERFDPRREVGEGVDKVGLGHDTDHATMRAPQP
jgi:hypothetical protein